MNSYTTLRGSIADSHRTGIGASDIPCLAGLTKKYEQTPLTLWMQKTGRAAPFAGNDATWWGHVHENAVLMRYIHDHYDPTMAELFLGEKVNHRSMPPFLIETEFRRADYSFALAHPDLLIADTPLIIEAKSHGLYAASRKDDPDFGYDPDDLSQNGIPAAVFLQVQWQLYCADLTEARVVVLINTNDFREYGPIRADKRVQEQCLALAERFWWHVQSDKEPMPTTWGDVKLLYPQPRNTTAMLPLETVVRVEADGTEITLTDMLMRVDRAKAAGKRAKAEVEDIQNAVGILMGDNTHLTDAEGNVLAKRQRSKYPSLALAKLKKEHPDVYAAVLPYTGTVEKDYIDIR